MSKSVPNSPRNQHELMKSNTLPPTAVLDASSNANASASPSRRSRGASLTNFLKKLSPKLRQNSSPVRVLKDRRPSTTTTTHVPEQQTNNSTTTTSAVILPSSNLPPKSAATDFNQLKQRASKEETAPTTTSTTISTTATATTTQPSSTSHIQHSPLLAASGSSGGSSPSQGVRSGGTCVRRTQQPPRTLNILNKIVVHPPPSEMERVKNKIASVESIGSCSLDADGTGSESSVTIDGRASSVSQRTLRSSGGVASSSTPKTSVKEIIEEVTMDKRSSKHMSKLYLNGHGVSSSTEDECRVDGEQRKKPSYIGISCSVSGYSNYSCYDSKVRQEGLRSRDNSPARLAFQNHQDNVRRTVDIEIDEMNGGLSFSSSEVHKSEATVLVNGENEIKKVSTFTMWRASSEDGILNGGGGCSSSSSSSIVRESRKNQSLQMASNESLSISTTPIKSLIQQRIERLYGPGALAQGFRKQAEIKNKSNEQLLTAKPTKIASSSSSQAKEGPKTNGTTNHTKINNISPTKDIQKKNGQNFIDAMNKERDRINSMIIKSEEYLLSKDLPEEARGKIRAAVGKANLLLSRKFRQFQGLCEKNLTQLPDEPFPTTVEDLTGFWDMVLIQVDDINRAFETIEKANQAGWCTDEIDSVPKKNGVGSEGKKIRKAKATVPVATSSKNNDNESALSKSRAEARRKLMELKSKGRQQKNSSNGIEIFVADDRGGKLT